VDAHDARREEAVTRGSLRVAAIVVGVAAGLGAGAAPVAADPQAEAVALFDQGIKDLKAGRLEKACSELQASLALIKDSGTKGALARCQGRAGRVASAWLLWRELSDTAPSAELRADATAQAAKLERRLPRYTIKLAAPAPGLTVQVNGRDVALDVPVAVPIDPGTVSVSAVGRDGERATTRTWSHDYNAVEGETLAIEIPVLEPLPVRTAPAEPVAPEVEAKVDVIDAPELHGLPPPELVARRHRRHLVAITAGSVAFAGATLGSILGIQARSRYDNAKLLCGGDIGRCATDQLGRAQDRVDTARRSALYADISFGVAGVATAVALYAWLSAPSLEGRAVTVAPSAGNGGTGIVLGGAF
jgi:hypothetical protein